MQKQFMLIIVLLFLLATAGALLFNQQQQQQAPQEFANTPLILKTLISDTQYASGNAMLIKAIEVERAGETLLIAQKNGEQWLSTHLSKDRTFRVQRAELLTLVRSLSDAKVIEYKSAKPQNHAKLGLADVGPRNTATTLLRVLGENDQAIEILVGAQASSQKGQYVRMKDDDQMLLIDQVIKLPDDKVDWLQTDLFNFNPMDIESVSRLTSLALLEGTSLENTLNLIDDKEPKDTAKEWRIERKNQTLVLADMQDIESLVYEEVLNNYLLSLNDLSFDDINELDQIRWGLFTPELVLNITTKQGNQHILTMVEQDSKYYVSVQGEQDYMHLNAWQFSIPSYQAEALLKTRDDFIKAQENIAE